MTMTISPNVLAAPQIQPVPIKDMVAMVTAMEDWSAVHPDDDLIVGAVFVAIRLFEENGEREAVPARFRALVQLVEDEEVLSWARPRQADGSQPIDLELLAEVSQRPLDVRGGRFIFTPAGFTRYSGAR